MPEVEKTGDLIWIGNWGDDERSAEILDFLVGPPALKLGRHGARRALPDHALAALAQAGIAMAAGSPMPMRRTPSPPTA